MPILVSVILLLLIPGSQAMELKSVDMEVSSLGEENLVDDRIHVQPSVTYGLNENFDASVGARFRYKPTEERMLYGFYTKLTWRPGKKKP